MERSIKKNYILNTAYQVLSIIIPLITAPYISRVLGAEKIGIYSFTAANVSYFSLIAVFGSGIFGQRYIASKRNDAESLSKAFWEVFLFRVISTCAVLAAYYVFVLCFIRQNSQLYWILGLSIIGVALDFSWFFQGIEDFPDIVLRNLLIHIASVICIFSFVRNASDLWLYVLFLVGLPLVGNIWTITLLPKYIHRPKNIKIFDNIKGMFQLFLPAMSTQVYLILDKTMIGLITSSDYQNGCYEQSEKVARLALTVVTSLGMVILPRVANLYNNGSQDKAKEYVYDSYRATWMLAFPIMFGIAFVAGHFVPVFFGAGYDLAKILMPIFSILVLSVGVAYVTGWSFLIPIGKQKVYTVAVCVSAGTNLCLNLMLIPIYGAVGAAVASVTAETLVVTIELIYCFKKHYLEPGRVFKPSVKYLISGIIMAICLYVLSAVLPYDLLGLIILIVFGAFVYFISLVLMRDSLVIDTIKNIMSKFKRERV